VNFLVFSDDWGGHPSSCQHLFQILTRRHPTIWVNTVGLRLPQLTVSDTVKGLQKLSAMLGLRPPPRPARHLNGHAPHVCVPLMTPFHRPHWLAALNHRALLHQVARAVQQQAFADFTLVTTTPTISGVVAPLRAQKVIYYCVDDFSEWPGMEKALILRLEQELLEQVDTVICSSQPLYEKFQAQYPTYLLRHGVDVELFSQAPAHEHACLRAIPKPRVGYYGNFDERNNQALIQALAQALPQVSFVFTGPIQANVATLRQVPNVYFTGAVAYEELPAVLQGWEACLLPYHYNALTVNINPLKLKEYLASGKPVIATPLPDVCELRPYLRPVADEDLAEWKNAIQEAISGRWQPDRTALAALLAHESWEHKAELFLRICQETGQPANSATKLCH
jgi:glycosyltransferase involved in cell wall biosynthesis